MFWILNLIFSYLAALFFGVIFDVPKRLYHTTGIVGACGCVTGVPSVGAPSAGVPNAGDSGS